MPAILSAIGQALGRGGWFVLKWTGLASLLGLTVSKGTEVAVRALVVGGIFYIIAKKNKWI